MELIYEEKKTEVENLLTQSLSNFRAAEKVPYPPTVLCRGVG
jgi:hypothetical protein